MEKEQLTFENEEISDETQLKELEKDKKETKRKPRTQRSFPQYSIEECLIIAKSIANNNSGNPWSPEQIASSINLSPKTNKFIYLVYASRDYGLTTGTKSTETIELTALGRKAVFPKDQVEEHEALDKAFKNIDVFKQVNEYYQKSGLPETRFLYNTLQETATHKILCKCIIQPNKYGLLASIIRDFLLIAYFPQVERICAPKA